MGVTIPDEPTADEPTSDETPEPLSHDQLEKDLDTLQRLIREQPDDAASQLETLYHRYAHLPKPLPGRRHSIWYRTYRLILHLWERWPRLTLYHKQSDMDGTNNGCERVIGWWIKERYRTMRGYKRTESILNVCTLTCLIGASKEPYDMSELFV